MKLKNKIILVVVIILDLSGAVIMGIWYQTSSKLTSTYLQNVSESSMKDAYHAFEYLLTDTSYMATMISENQKNVIQPVNTLNSEQIKQNNQWNQIYLENRRKILEYLNGIDGYKYYISGISIAANEKCIFSSNHVIEQNNTIYQKVKNLNCYKLKKTVIMMEPIHMEGLKSTVSSDYVVLAVRAITDDKENIIGYVIVYFDYSVIDQMFSVNLPKNSYFEVINDQGTEIYANRDRKISVKNRAYVSNTFYAKNVGWTFKMSIPSEYYISGIQKTMVLTGMVIIMIIGLAVLILTFFVTKLTGEITVLRNKMKEVSKGDLTVQYRIKENDEIGQMGETFNGMVYQISDLMKQVAQEERDKRIAEMAFLQAQINPHFVSNVLNNVAWMAKIQHADNIIPLVNALNYLLRAVIHQDNALICLKKELEYVDNYLVIMEYSGSFDFQVERQIEPDTLSLYVPRFILQPIIENAIYHGIPVDLSKQGKILIKTCIQKERLEIWIEDNGEGMPEEAIKKILSEKKKDKKSFNGIGVANVNERIRLCFGDAYGLHYESKIGAYTRCVFVLPVIREVEENGKDTIGFGR